MTGQGRGENAGWRRKLRKSREACLTLVIRPGLALFCSSGLGDPAFLSARARLQPPVSPAVANEGRNDYHPMFFTHDRAFEELFGICIQLLNKTWKEMRATAEDFNKVGVPGL